MSHGPSRAEVRLLFHAAFLFYLCYTSHFSAASAFVSPALGSTFYAREKHNSRAKSRVTSPRLAFASVEEASQKTPTRIVIAGGGVAGLAVAYQLLNQTTTNHLSIEIMDSMGVGEGGATSAMAGLLHPLTPRGKKIWLGEEGMIASRALIQVASQHSATPILSDGTRDVAAEGKGIVRLVTKGEKQERDYTKCHEMYPDETELVSPPTEDLRGVSPDIALGLRVTAGLALNGSLYARGLWEACRAKGSDVSWTRRDVESLSEVWAAPDVDAVVVAAGAGAVHIRELTDHLLIQRVKSQNVRFERNASHPADPALAVPVISGRYVVPFQGPKEVHLYAGASQEEERGNVSRAPNANLSAALANMQHELSVLYPPIRSPAWIPVECKAGVKALPPRTAKGSIPIVGRLNGLEGKLQRTWILTGLGSRGLIHHGVLAEKLAKAILSDNEDILPADTRTIPLLARRQSRPAS